jgi:catechol 2,3-dioxygenase-like lactoylglutathione lyase family enzyme
VFDHVTINVSDRVASERFYATVLPVLGKERTGADQTFTEYDDFSFAFRGPASRGLHIAFFAESTDIVDAFWQVGTGAGFTDDGAPGARPQYGPDYYGAFLRDPDGNSVEAVTSTHSDRKPGQIDHLWLRTRDIAAAKAFYETIGPHAGFGLGDDTADRVQFITSRATFSFVTGGPPTEHVHLAWPAETNEIVDAFHAAAVEAGYKSNGAPGERAVYHPGYYAAFVFDPDGHNVEVVNHNR